MSNTMTTNKIKQDIRNYNNNKLNVQIKLLELTNKIMLGSNIIDLDKLNWNQTIRIIDRLKYLMLSLKNQNKQLLQVKSDNYYDMVPTASENRKINSNQVNGQIDTINQNHTVICKNDTYTDLSKENKIERVSINSSEHTNNNHTASETNSDNNTCTVQNNHLKNDNIHIYEQNEHAESNNKINRYVNFKNFSFRFKNLNLLRITEIIKSNFMKRLSTNTKSPNTEQQESKKVKTTRSSLNSQKINYAEDEESDSTELASVNNPTTTNTTLNSIIKSKRAYKRIKPTKKQLREALNNAELVKMKEFDNELIKKSNSNNNQAKASNQSSTTSNKPNVVNNNKVLNKPSNLPVKTSAAGLPSSTTASITTPILNKFNIASSAKLFQQNLDNRKKIEQANIKMYVSVPEGNTNKKPKNSNLIDADIDTVEPATTPKETPKLKTSEQLRLHQNNQMNRLTQMAAFATLGGNVAPQIPHLPKPSFYNKDTALLNLEKLIDSIYLTDEDKDTVSAIITKIHDETVLTTDEIDKLSALESRHNEMETETTICLAILDKIKSMEIDETFNKNLKTAIEQYETKKYFETNVRTWLKMIGDQLKLKNQITIYTNVILDWINNPKLSKDLETTVKAFALKTQTPANLNLIDLVNEWSLLESSVKKQLDMEIKYELINEYLDYVYLGNTHREILEIAGSKIVDGTVNDTDLKEVDDIISICQIIQNDKQYYENMAKLLEENRPFEIKYPRSKFSLQISGKGIFAFDNLMSSRQSEIVRCKQVKGLQTVELIRNKNPDEEFLTEQELMEVILEEKEGTREIYITIDNYDDLVKMMKPWPSDSFVCGVKPRLKPMEDIIIMINGVEKSFTKSNINSISVSLEQEHGIVDVSRQHKQNDINQPTGNLQARALTMLQLINACKNGVPINPKFRVTKPKYKVVRVCSLCGSLEHFKCGSIQRCIICASVDHITDRCPVERDRIRCINCHRSGHRCDSEECRLLRTKIYESNEYLLSIMLGENIIRDQSEILRIPEHDRASNGLRVDEDSLRTMVNDLITKNELIQNINSRLEIQEEESKLFRAQMDNLTTNQENLMTQLQDVKEELRAESHITRAENAESHDSIMETLTYILHRLPDSSNQTKRPRD